MCTHPQVKKRSNVSCLPDIAYFGVPMAIAGRAARQYEEGFNKSSHLLRLHTMLT